MIWAATGAMTTVLLASMGLLSFWVARGFDGIESRLDRMDARFDRMDARFDQLEGSVLREHGERIARLEERSDS